MNTFLWNRSFIFVTVPSRGVTSLTLRGGQAFEGGGQPGHFKKNCYYFTYFCLSKKFRFSYTLSNKIFYFLPKKYFIESSLEPALNNLCRRNTKQRKINNHIMIRILESFFPLNASNTRFSSINNNLAHSG